MADKLDPRIGKYTEKGLPEYWPDVDVTGQRYTRPATTQGIGERHFVVLPPRAVDAEVMAEIEAIVFAAEQPVVEAPQVEAVETAAAAPLASEEQPASSDTEPRSSRRGNRSES